MTPEQVIVLLILPLLAFIALKFWLIVALKTKEVF